MTESTVIQRIQGVGLPMPGLTAKPVKVDDMTAALAKRQRSTLVPAATPIKPTRLKVLPVVAKKTVQAPKKSSLASRVKRLVFNRHVAKGTALVVGGVAAGLLYTFVPVARYAMDFFMKPIVSGAKDIFDDSKEIYDISKQIAEYESMRRWSSLGQPTKDWLAAKVSVLKDTQRSKAVSIGATALKIAGTVASLGVFDLISSTAGLISKGLKLRASVRKLAIGTANGEPEKRIVTWKDDARRVLKVINDLAPTVLKVTAAVGGILIVAGAITATGPAGVAIGVIGLAATIWCLSNRYGSWVMA